MTTLVLILPGEAPASATAKVQALFSNPLFTTEIFVGSSTQPASAINKSEIDTARYLEALQYAGTRYPDAPVILVRDSTISVADSDIIARKVASARAIPDFDLFYLSKFLDECQKYRSASEGEAVWTQSPHGSQCIYFTPRARDIVLGKINMKNGQYFKPGPSVAVALTTEIRSGNLKAITTRTNLVDYDISLAVSNLDFNRVNECHPVPVQSSYRLPFMGSYFWFIVIVVVILLLGWALLKMGSK